LVSSHSVDPQELWLGFWYTTIAVNCEVVGTLLCQIVQFKCHFCRIRSAAACRELARLWWLSPLGLRHERWLSNGDWCRGFIALYFSCEAIMHPVLRETAIGQWFSGYKYKSFIIWSEYDFYQISPETYLISTRQFRKCRSQ
jgi:hypothetical protein